MHAVVAALARKHGWSAAASADVAALVAAVSAPGRGAPGDESLPPPPDLALAWLLDGGPGSGPPVDADRYEVLGELGRGGMGVVQRVRDRRLDRVVARKVMHQSLSDGARARFVEEAQATARLQHPGIAPVYDAGEGPDGRPWFTMKEVQGETLRSVIRAEHLGAAAASGDRSVGLRRLVTIFHAACQAVGFAHARGVVHRDLKPTNVMIGAHGEVLVVDWGIAKVLAGRAAAAPGAAGDTATPEGIDQTLVGMVLGTPAFMAPEQARGDVASIDARSDVYALGAVLYEVLTGAAPYRGDSAEVVASVVAGPPPSLRGLPGAAAQATFGVDVTELVEVCERAMSRASADRHPDASALGDAVQSWLDGSRRREQALAVVAAAARQGPEAAAARARAAALRAAAASSLRALLPWSPEEEKAAAWAQEDEAAALEERAALADQEEESLLRGSLTHAPGLPEAHAALVERYRRAHAEAEAARTSPAQPEAMLRHHLGALPDHHPVRQSALTYLRGDGALTLETDPSGAAVELFRYVLRNRRLVAVPERHLGTTPLRAVSLPHGSWLCVLRHPERAPVRYPVWIGRGEHWDGVPPDGGSPLPVSLPRADALGPMDCVAPAGWAWLGGDRDAPNSLPRQRLWVDGHVFRRFPVTNREYLAFLDTLVAEGRAEEALRHAPRERAGTTGELGALIYAFDGQRFSLRADADGDVWAPEWPVILVTWHAARAFAAWEGARTGRPWTLPSEVAWEKAARGADGRRFPWGEWVDPSWTCTTLSHRGRPLPTPVGSFPVDESVYGIRDLGGNVRDWCLDAWHAEGPPVVGGRGSVAEAPEGSEPNRVLRGGGWNYTPNLARAASRDRGAPVARSSLVGIRLARPLS